MQNLSVYICLNLSFEKKSLRVFQSTQRLNKIKILKMKWSRYQRIDDNTLKQINYRDKSK